MPLTSPELGKVCGEAVGSTCDGLGPEGYQDLTEGPLPGCNMVAGPGLLALFPTFCCCASTGPIPNTLKPFCFQNSIVAPQD